MVLDTKVPSDPVLNALGNNVKLHYQLVLFLSSTQMAQGAVRDHIGIVISCLREFEGIRTMHSPCSYRTMILPLTGIILLNNYTQEQVDLMGATLLLSFFRNIIAVFSFSQLAVGKLKQYSGYSSRRPLIAIKQEFLPPRDSVNPKALWPSESLKAGSMFR